MRDKINVEVTINREELVKALKAALTAVRPNEVNNVNRRRHLALMEYIWYIKNGVKQMRSTRDRAGFLPAHHPDDHWLRSIDENARELEDYLTDLYREVCDDQLLPSRKPSGYFQEEFAKVMGQLTEQLKEIENERSNSEMS